MVNTFCGQGATITYKRDLLAEHGVALLTGVAGALVWVDARLAGTPPAPGCHISTVLTNLLSPGTVAAFGSQLILANFLAFAGQPFGPTGPSPR